MRDMRIIHTPTEMRDLLALFQERALHVALAQVGRGEDPTMGNNRGYWVDVFRAGDGVKRLFQRRVGGSGAWCATFASYCDQVAAQEINIICPHDTSRSAKRLVHNVGRSGGYVAKAGAWPRRRVSWFQPDGKIPPGAWIAWDASARRMKNPSHRWRGHVARVVEHLDDDSLVVIDGNRNCRPKRKGGRIEPGEGPPSNAKVKRWSVVDTMAFPPGVWRKRLAAIASYV